ncbi:MAG: hypothetical protein AMXMBFR57_17840 [Acidimicrobiia bacterium]
MVHVDGGLGEVQSLSELVKMSDAVVIGTVTGARSSSLAPGIPDEAGTFLSTAYTLEIQEAIVWPSSTRPNPPVVEVELHGVGDHDRGDHVLRLVPERLRALTTGHQYLLFLKTYRLGRAEFAKSVWILATGDGQSILEIIGNRNAPQASSGLALALARMSSEELAVKIREIRGGGGSEATSPAQSTPRAVPR